MNNLLKNRFILILIVLAVILFISSIGSCINVNRLKTSRDKEMFTRMDLEERMTKAMQDRAALETKLNDVTKDLETEKALSQELKKGLIQERLVTQSLKEELYKVTGNKETPEDKSTKGKKQ